MRTTLSRSRDGKWVGGVCAGLARGRGIGVGWARSAFVLGTLIGGLGAVVYLACWLIIPGEGEQPGDLTSGWIVALAKACAACVVLAALGVLAAGATLFGFGWVAAALASAVLLGVLVAWPRFGPAWALLPVAAIALPSAAVAATGVELVPQPGHEMIAPKTLTTNGVVTFRAGIGTMLIDLENTALPPSGVVRVRIQGGVRRTIVALPHDRCVHVDVAYRVQPFLAELANQVTGRFPFRGIVVFGNNLTAGSGADDVTSPVPGPTLKIDFSSTGGSLYVRDYPATIDPEVRPDWPGYRVFPELRPDTRGLSRRQARYELGAWRVRRAAEVRSQRLVDSLRPGPCGTTGAAR
jgi:phage shock protein PspC (stress-responsive transcriptional regulator)